MNLKNLQLEDDERFEGGDTCSAWTSQREESSSAFANNGVRGWIRRGKLAEVALQMKGLPILYICAPMLLLDAFPSLPPA